MYIVGENPASSFPRPDLVTEALACLDFLVVQDMFLTETAKLATVVLPAASFAEKEGTYTNFEGRVQRACRAIEPPGDSLPDSEIILQLATTMGSPMPYSSLRQVMDEIDELVPLYQAMGYADLETNGVYQAGLGGSPLGMRRLHKGQFPSGFGRFSPVQYIPRAEVGGDGYPLTLLAGTTLHHSGTGSRSSRSSRLSKFSPQAYVEIGESDARQLGISHSDEVKVISPVGEVTTVARVTNTLPEGMLFMPVSFAESPVNALFDIALDPRSKTPSVKACAVRLERTGRHG